MRESRMQRYDRGQNFSGSFYTILVAVCLLVIISFVYKDAFAQAPGSTMISLYFVDANELKLGFERRNVTQASNTVEQIKLTISELIRGPMTGLIATIPESTEVREVFLDEKGCAYVDFSRAISQNHPGGSTYELITIASIVNTLTSNFPEEIRRVMILIEGKEAVSLAGHIDISKPIFPFELG